MTSPLYFLGHGSPMNIIASNSFVSMLQNEGAKIQSCKAVICISAHWETEGSFVQSSKLPKTIHDFYGFPQALYDIKPQYQGNTDIANQIAASTGIIQPTEEWGIDHGTWSLLVHLLPEFKGTVQQISLNKHLSWAEHFELAQKLQFLRDQNVTIICSGDLVHNLRKIQWQEEAPVADWAAAFDKKMVKLVLAKDFSAIEKLQATDEFREAHPTAEHFIPLIYFLGLLQDQERVRLVYEGIQNASISMTSFSVN